MTALRKTFKLFLWKAFDIREGEERKAGLMQLLIFLIISTLLIVKPTVNSMFIKQFGVEQLPFAFILVAIIAAAMSRLYSQWLTQYSLYKIMVGTLVLSTLGLVSLGALFQIGGYHDGIIYGFYVGVAIFAVLTASQFWLLANMVFDVREAKRLFGFIGAGAIAGGIFGGYLTSFLVKLMRSENLVFIGATFLLVALPIVQYVWKNYLKVGVYLPEKSKAKKKITRSPLSLIYNSKHLLYLAVIIGVGVIVAKLVDYQFSEVAADFYTDQDELTAFFGFWFSTFNVISLLIQLLLTRRFVGKYGVGTSLLFLPAGILIGAVALLFAPALWAAILIKLSDGSFKQSIHKAAIELLALPIPPEIKKQTKTYIDVVIDSVATGIGGLILLFLVRGLDLSIRSISVMIIVLIAVWFYFAWKVKQEYLLSFKLKTKKARQRDLSKITNFSKGGWENTLIHLLESGSDRQTLVALRKIRKWKYKLSSKYLEKFLHHSSPNIRAEVIKSLEKEDDIRLPDEILEEIVTMIEDPAARVREAAFEYVIKTSEGDISPILQEYLEDENRKLSNAALVGLAMHSQDKPNLATQFQLGTKVAERLTYLEKKALPKERKRIKIALLKTIGYARLEAFYPFIEKCLQENGFAVSRQAILSTGDSLDEKLLEIMQEILMTNIRNKAISLKNLEKLPVILSIIESQQATDLLFALLAYEQFTVRNSALIGLRKMQQRFPELEYDKSVVLGYTLKEAQEYQEILSELYAQRMPQTEHFSEEKIERVKIAQLVLVSLLEKQLDVNLKRIFWYLELMYNSADMRSIYRGIHSRKSNLRINALEFLDNVLDFNLKKVIVPIVEITIMSNISKNALMLLNLNIPNEMESLERLIDGKDEKIKLAASNLLKVLMTEYFSPLLGAEDLGSA
ncbi:MAG: AAA family ATP:ADP antiporter [Saprospiraceae bacterium]|jgi:AAA family ATP:ADP antiporter